jgi:hypothetical protein
MNAKTIMKDQSGAALVVALIMIVVLTLIGLASTFSSTFEISLSGNKRLSTDAFYNAETRMYSMVPKAMAIDDQANPHTGDNLGGGDLTPGEIDSGLREVDGGSVVNRRTVIDPSHLSSQLPLPGGKILNDKTTVTLYHCWVAGGGGEGMSGFKADSYIIDAEGTDQIVSSSQYKSTVHLRMKILTHRPTTEESQ